MRPLLYTALRKLEDFTEDMCFTIYLPVSSEVDPQTTLAKIWTKAEKHLSKVKDPKEAEILRVNLELVLNKIEWSRGTGTWLGFSSFSVSDTYFLPAILEEEFSVGKRFIYLPALYYLYRKGFYWVGLLGESTARFFELIGGNLIESPLESSVKQALEQYQKAQSQLSHATSSLNSWDELLTRLSQSSAHVFLMKYLEEVTRLISYHVLEEKYPTFLLGNETILRKVQQVIGDVSNFTAIIGGVYETASPEVILHTLNEHITQKAEIEKQTYLPYISYVEVMPIEAIWKELRDHPTHPILFIEKGYTYPLKQLVGRNTYHTDDAVDVLIAQVYEHGGKVIWAEPGELPSSVLLLNL
ncbi:MAG: hypothetical protein ACUVRD_05960 [Bacteroidia bacterium]